MGPPQATAVDVAAYRTAIGQMPTGVTVVTSTGERGPSGLTASAVCSLSLEPLLIVVCIDLGSRTLAAVRRSGRLAVNVLAEDQQQLARHFASKVAEEEKFDGIAYRDVDGLPLLEGAVAWLTADVRELLPGGDHVIGVAAVTGVDAPGGAPLVHHRGIFRGLSS